MANMNRTQIIAHIEQMKDAHEHDRNRAIEIFGDDGYVVKLLAQSIGTLDVLLEEVRLD